jgi:DNA-binding transcriptional LysR family regulator
MPNRIKMRHLEAVIALAEEMHYGRAAKRVGLTQSGLSRCIQSAEREANASLFERNRSGIELTDAGRSYVEHARISVAYGERAMRSAIERREGADTVLQIGKAPDVDPALVDILYSIRLPFFPTLDITVQSESSSDLAHDLLSTDLDLALITDPTQNAKLTMTKLSETPLHVVIPRDHILSSKVSLKMADLRDERWIVFQKRTHPVLYERIMKRTKMRAFTRGASTISSTQKKDISNYRPDHVLVFHRASRGIEKHEALMAMLSRRTGAKVKR